RPGAQQAAGEQRLHHLGAVLADHRHPVAGPHGLRGQPVAGPLDAPPHGAVAQRAAVLFVQEHRVRLARGAVLQQVVNARGQGGSGHSASAVPRMAVDWLDSVPPLPCTSARRALATWRSPQSPRNCRTASIMMKTPYMPGCTQHRPPPLVLTGSRPPGAMAPSSMNAPPSPLAQKPRSSRNRMVLMVNAS